MKKIITQRLATNFLLMTLSLMVIVHFLILFQIIPFQVVWGGRITDQSQVMRFELISITVVSILLVIVAIKAELIKSRMKSKVISVVLWLMCILFLLNTVGNLFSGNN